MVLDNMMSSPMNGFSETLSKMNLDANAGNAEFASFSDDGSQLSENVEACQLSESTEDVERKQNVHQGQRQKTRKRHDTNADGTPKSLVDPRKYKTKMCRNWKATGVCPYEHTCCYAHGDLETRTMHQNNNVLSSLGYFSGIMLLAMKDEKPGGKNPSKAGKKPPAKHTAALTLKRPEVQSQPEPQQSLLPPTTPTVHSPYCLPEAEGFGTESGPGSPLGFGETQMPSYSYRSMEYPPKSASFCYGPYPDPMPQYELPEYCMAIPSPYGAYPASPIASPLGYAPCYPVYEGYPTDSGYSQQNLEIHQAAMEKHPALRNMQAGEMSQKQLQKVLHDIMYSSGNKQQRRTKKQGKHAEGGYQE